MIVAVDTTLPARRRQIGDLPDLVNEPVTVLQHGAGQRAARLGQVALDPGQTVERGGKLGLHVAGKGFQVVLRERLLRERRAVRTAGQCQVQLSRTAAQDVAQIERTAHRRLVIGGVLRIRAAEVLMLHVPFQRLRHIGPGVALVAHEGGRRGQGRDGAVRGLPLDCPQKGRAGLEIGVLGQEPRDLYVGLHARAQPAVEFEDQLVVERDGGVGLFRRQKTRLHRGVHL